MGCNFGFRLLRIEEEEEEELSSASACGSRVEEEGEEEGGGGVVGVLSACVYVCVRTAPVLCGFWTVLCDCVVEGGGSALGMSAVSFEPGGGFGAVWW